MTANLPDLMLNDRGFAFDPSNGETFQLNPTGLRIVRLLQQGKNEDDALATLMEEFEVDENTARRDLESFLGSLTQLGWLENEFSNLP